MYLTPLDKPGRTAASKKLGATVGGLTGIATGMTAGVGAAMLLVVPGIGQVVAIGVGAAALLGMAGARAGCARREKLPPTTTRSNLRPAIDARRMSNSFATSWPKATSLIVVRSESQEVANVANGVLSPLGINPQERHSDQECKSRSGRSTTSSSSTSAAELPLARKAPPSPAGARDSGTGPQEDSVQPA